MRKKLNMNTQFGDFIISTKLYKDEDDSDKEFKIKIKKSISKTKEEKNVKLGVLLKKDIPSIRLPSNENQEIKPKRLKAESKHEPKIKIKEVGIKVEEDEIGKTEVKNDILDKNKKKLNQMKNIEVRKDSFNIQSTSDTNYLTQEALEIALTDGIVEFLRKQYFEGLLTIQLTQEQKDYFIQFVIHPPIYIIKILSKDLTDQNEFRKTHFISDDVKIQINNNFDKLHPDQVVIVLTLSKISDYFNYERYFISHNFDVLIYQEFNKTKETIKILRDLYRIYLTQKENNPPVIKNSITNEQKQQESQQTQNTIKLKEVTDNAISSNQPPSNKDSETIRLEFNQPQKELSNQDEIVTDAEIKYKDILNYMEIISKSESRKKLVQSMISFQCQKYNFYDIQCEFNMELDYIQKAKQLNQQIDLNRIQEFQQQFSLNAVTNYLIAIFDKCKNN